MIYVLKLRETTYIRRLGHYIHQNIHKCSYLDLLHHSDHHDDKGWENMAILK
jgi:hypothetical protein